MMDINIYYNSYNTSNATQKYLISTTDSHRQANNQCHLLPIFITEGTVNFQLVVSGNENVIFFSTQVQEPLNSTYSIQVKSPYSRSPETR